ncbi:MAG TPA: LCP family protein [Actinomycetota bacterium]|nr:LCP family protein [Actinomycetota bacterium]
MTATYPPPPPPKKRRGNKHAVAKKPPQARGTRTERLKGRRRERLRKQGAAGLVATILLSGLAAAGAVFTVQQVTGPDDPKPSATALPEDPVRTMLVIGTNEQKGGPQAGAVWLSLFYANDLEGTGGLIYFPAHTAAEIPGRGLQDLSSALSSGGLPLLLVSVENLFGVPVDSYIELSDKDAQVLFEETGPVSVDVPYEVRVPAGPDQARLLFTEGVQRLDASFMVKLLYTQGIDGDEVELGGRHVVFWDAFFDHFAEDPEALRGAVTDASAALSESDADVEVHAELLTFLAQLPPTERSLVPLPVRQTSVEADELYVADVDEMNELAARAFGEDHAVRDEVRVQILNGNGVPGIGQVVATKLIGQGFRVVLTGNARHLNYSKTLIVTYDSSEEGHALAERAKKLLGVGEIQVSVQQQGIVDLTIVVGKDFVREQ